MKFLKKYYLKMITMLNLLTWKFFLIYLIRESLLNIDVCSADDYLS